MERLNGIPEETFHLVEGFRFAHDDKTVAILQSQRVGRQQFHVATRHPTDIHAVSVAELQLSEPFTVQNAARKHQNSALDLRIDVVPVDFLFVPIGFRLLAKQHFECRSVVFVRHHHDVVVELHHRICLWHKYLTVAPDTRNDKMQMGQRRHFRDAFSVQSGIDNDILRDIGLILGLVVAQFKVLGLHEKAPNQHHDDNHAEHTERIGHCRGQSRRTRRNSELRKGLLSGTERRRIRRGTAEHTSQVGQAHARQRHHAERHQRADRDDGETPQVEFHALVAQRTEKVGADVQSEHINEHNQAESLGIVEHLRIDAKTEVSGQNADEKHESHAQRNSADAHFS